ncbi:metallophosphoesterase [Sphingomonas nostoxanthinifaciens]|uniref:metallophosphoesterase n=1 Tax=Sphingomonas nostoxanthinifaciens TaxID=2872652 RepID=UPI001CC2049B|nr:metallophosphoesterase [Sphingomonas nostoxanthinifaciens]UAK22874.1 metallophosphoesterase [Sphingomonas nostoxanthinifaciens]
MIRVLFSALLVVAMTASLPSGAAAERPSFSFGAIADCQFAAEPDAPPRLYHTAPDKLAEAVTRFDGEKLAFVTHLGDFIDRDWVSYDVLLPIVRRSHHPWRFVLGNHDFGVPDAQKAAVPAKLGMPARYYSFTKHGWLFIVTDGNDLSSYAWPEGSAEHARSMAAHAGLYADKPLWDGGIGDVQMRWIDAQLTHADAAGQKAVLLSHFPLYPANPHNLWNADAMLALLDRHPSVKMWLDGHNHEGNYGLRNGIHFVNLKAMLDTTETAYARIDMFADRIEVHGFGRQQDMVLPLR